MPESDKTGISDIQERREDARELSIKEALALLENRPFTPAKVRMASRLRDMLLWPSFLFLYSDWLLIIYSPYFRLSSAIIYSA